ncbi:uncharacterized protein EI90DRAFT_1384766 [Cantharellus anzutake]|uniref:uncharacterized protein n=1 Tax=Cantharellus anzutake TaxID=1750568 RepID=UPI001905DC83|nr:uncharacterized protein EI90DRAFT_1384766 [Cantharellus anzutake]KAF8329365.1 hypothetical protein EI90DRAFT_1384766 [Cantharellus anzutake]
MLGHKTECTFHAGHSEWRGKGLNGVHLLAPRFLRRTRDSSKALEGLSRGNISYSARQTATRCESLLFLQPLSGSFLTGVRSINFPSSVMMTAFATKGLDLNFDGYTPTRYYPSPSAEVLQSTPADCAPWKELFDCTWRADLRVLMLRDLSAGRYGFQHHRIPRASASAARMSASPSYDIIYHIDMDADTLRKVAKDPGGVLDDPEVPSLFEVFERMRIWIRQDPVAKYDIEGRMDAEAIGSFPDKGIFLIPSEPDDVDQLETGASLHPIIPIQAPKRRRNTVSLPYSRPRPLSPRLRSHSIPNSPALSRPWNRSLLVSA